MHAQCAWYSSVPTLFKIAFLICCVKLCCRFNRSTVKQGFKAVKSDKLDAFIYDATVLEYLVGQDDECNILTVGSWYAMTGYGVAFPKGSPWVSRFNEHLMHYRENGDLERMQRFWFTGACEPRKRRRTSSKPLALAQFMSAFLLLGIGTSLSVLLLLFEHAYFKYMREFLSGLSKYGWCALISLSFADSLKKPDTAQEMRRGECDSSDSRECQDLVCQMNLHVLTQELYKSQARIVELKSLLEGGEDGSDLHLVIQTGGPKSFRTTTVKIPSQKSADYELTEYEMRCVSPEYDEVETVL